MKNHNLLIAFLLALPLFIVADAPMDAAEEAEDVSADVVEVTEDEEEVVVDEEVSTGSSGSVFVSDDDVEEVVVTGSRMKKSTFTSISPLQIISAETSREVGLIDATSILQESPTASGQQVDLSFAGFSLDNGPGTTQVSLRGLGSNRTLVLINGRRVGPAGVEGAPYAPDLSLLPGSLIQRYEVLLDGASSVYGSDAIAGVTNAILRSDFEGWEVEAYAAESPYQDGFTDDITLNLTWGKVFDRGFIGMGLEYVNNPMVTYDDRPWTEDCEVEYEITREGEIRTKNLYYTADGYSDQALDCKVTADVANVWTQQSRGIWTLYYQDGADINSYVDAGGWPTIYSSALTDVNGNTVYGYYDSTTGELCANQNDAGASCGAYAIWPMPDPTTAIESQGFQDPDAAGWIAQSIFAVDVDMDGDGISDVTRADFNVNGNDGFSSMYPEFEKTSFMAFGDYTFENGTEVFFELQHAEKETYSINGGVELYPMVPASNPYNICNPANENGFDCGLYGGTILQDADYVADATASYNDAYGFTAPDYYEGNFGWDNFGNCTMQYAQYCAPYTGWFGYPGGYWSGIWGSGVIRSSIYNGVHGERDPIPIQPYVAVKGDRTNVATEFVQTRGVVGVTGDVNLESLIPAANGWTYEVSHTMTKSNGLSFREGVRGDRLAYSLGYDPSAEYGNQPDEYVYNGSFYEPVSTLLPNGACDPTGAAGTIDADLQDGCVPVNMFAPSLYNGIVGEFATQAERDYLFDTSTFDTEIIQNVTSAYMTGMLGTLPGGDIGVVVGIENQKLHMMSNPDKVADEGLFFDYSANGGARGVTRTEEAYFEVAMPIIAGVKYVEELNVEFSGRATSVETINYYTDGQQSDSGNTFATKISYRPITDVLLRATRGTSFRAPNIREVALRNEEVLTSVYDYCIPPTGAWRLNADSTAYIYDAERDFREQITLDNCFEAGVNPYNLGNTFAVGGNTYRSPTTSIIALTGGATNLDSETSISETWGVVWDVDYSRFFADADGSTNTTIGLTHYDIDIRGTIVEPTVGYINYDCFVGKSGYTSVWCNNITRDEFGYISEVQAGFLNRDSEIAAGLDLNILHTFSFTLGDRFIDAGIDITANKVKERSLLYVNDENENDREDYVGEPGYPEYYIYSRFFADLGDWRLSWQTTFMDDVAQDEEDELDDWGNAWGLENEDGQNIKSHTCLGEDYGDTDCRDIGFINNYVVHNMSLYYRQDNWNLGIGVRNVFDKEPPMVDGTEIQSKSNVPLGYGYNINGRSYFMNVLYRF